MFLNSRENSIKRLFGEGIVPRIDVKLPHHSYPIIVESACYKQLKNLIKTQKVIVVADSNVWGFLEESFLSNLEGFDVEVLIQQAGEENKNLETIKKHYDVLAGKKLERKTTLVALGGGVLGDSAGFVAATFLRGLPFIQCPTSLLSMVDASVGGKVGVNLEHGKNLVGAFYQPDAVLINPEVLKSLPKQEFVSGMAECVKHAIIRDKNLFNWTKENIEGILKLDLALVSELISRNVQIKASVVEQDEKEQNIRALLNLGHTYAHALESVLGYGTISHGEAVSLGLVAASKLSSLLGNEDISKAVIDLLDLIGLPTKYDIPETKILVEKMYSDKKVSSGKLRFVVPKSIGDAEVVSVQDENLIVESLQVLKS